MQTFKLFMKLVKQYRGQVILYFSIFLGTMIILSKVQAGEGETSYTQTKLDVGVAGDCSGEFAKGLITYFEKEHNLQIIEENEAEIAEALYWRELDYVLVIPADVTTRLQAHDTEGLLQQMQVPGSFSGSYFESELRMYLSRVIALYDTGYSLQEIGSMMEQLAGEKTTVEMTSQVNEKKSEPVVLLFQYAAYGMISVCISAIAMILLSMNREDVKRRIACASNPLRSRIAGITMGIVIFGIVLLAAILIVAGIMSHGSIFTDSRFPYFIGNLLGILTFSQALAFLTGMVSSSKEVVNGVVNIASLGLCFLGGIFVPQEFFSDKILVFAKLMPTYWYVKNHEMIAGMTEVTGEFTKNYWSWLFVIFAFAIAVFAGALVLVSAKRKSK